MALLRLTYTIRGITPLLMNNPAPSFGGSSEGSSGAKGRGGSNIIPPEEKAILAAYRTPEGYLCMPTSAIRKCLITAAVKWKYKRNGRGREVSMADDLSHIEIDPWEWIILYNDDDTNTPITEHEIDIRRAVPPGQGAIPAGRARVPHYKATFTVLFDEGVFQINDPYQQVYDILNDAGARIGWGAYRPERIKGKNGTSMGGPFGKFTNVTSAV